MQDEELEVEPPTAARVARRALVLGAVSGRALTERDPGVSEQRPVIERLWRWIGECDLEEELEPDERTLLASPEPWPPQTNIDAVWRIEGLGVLTWALGLAELPPYDTLVDPPTLFRAIALLRDPAAVFELVGSARLRPIDELTAMQAHLLAFHWRMVDLRVRPAPMDFVAFSQDGWFGSFSLDRFRIVDDDLALGDVAVAAAGSEARSRAESTARERHQAINWLLGGSRIYSETDSST